MIRAAFILMLVACVGCTPQFALMNYPGEPATTTKSPKSQCQACADIARDAENRSYKQACAEMKRTHEAEQKRIKAQRDACPVGESVILETGQTVTTPAPAGELLPDAFILKDAPKKTCKDGICH